MASNRGREAKPQNTLRSLQAILQALNEDPTREKPKPRHKSLDDDSAIPTVDEHLQKEGAETFGKFYRRVMDLDRELRFFSNAIRPLGSSVGILSASFHLRERLELLVHLFRENAADLFPRKVSKESGQVPAKPGSPSGKRRQRPGTLTRLTNPQRLEKADLEAFPEELEGLASDMTNLLDCLNEFPEFTDEAVNSSILALNTDLKYWAACLRDYQGQFREDASVKRYVHELTLELGEYMEELSTALSMFKDIGIPAISSAQQQAATNLQSMSTLATFFSAVTATTLQYSFQATGRPVDNAVNGFWFTSLVFSIAAAVNSLLGMTSKQIVYQSRPRGVPPWVSFWIKESSLLFLIFSVACFSTGLVLFAYSSGQHYVTSAVTTTFSVCTGLGLTSVALWLAVEHWISSNYEYRGQFKFWEALGRALARKRADIAESVESIASWILNTIVGGVHLVTYGCMRGFSFMARGPSSKRIPERDTEADFNSMTLSPTDTHLPIIKDEDSHPVDLLPISPTSPSATLAPRSRFREMVRTVIRQKPETKPEESDVPSVFPGATTLPTIMYPTASSMTHNPQSMSSLRVAKLVAKVCALAVTQDLAAHAALVRHVQFSPTGEYLATASWDRTALIFKVDSEGGPFPLYRTLAHSQGFVTQLAWSPDGKTILTKFTHGIKVWTEHGVCKCTIYRENTVQSIAWLPNGEAFLSVELGRVIEMDLHGTIRSQYHVERVILRNIVVCPDSMRIILTGTLTHSPNGHTPSRGRPQEQIIVYNIASHHVESRVPLVNDVRSITLARNSDLVLVSYENFVSPQLWRLENVKDRTRLSLRHTYLPRGNIDFAGPSYFGGTDDEIVVCFGRAGDIYLWDRDSGTILHHIKTTSLNFNGDLTCLGWNPTSDSFMFATGSHDGAVKIWTAQEASSRPSELVSRLEEKGDLEVVVGDMEGSLASWGSGS